MWMPENNLEIIQLRLSQTDSKGCKIMSDESTIRILRDKIEVRDRALLKCAREYEGGYLAGAQRLVMDWIYKAQDSMMADREKIALKPTKGEKCQ